MIAFLIGAVFSLFVLIPLVLVLWLLVYAARAATVSVGRCARCGYDLRGLGERRACPECGLGFRVNAAGDPLSVRGPA